MIIKRETIEDAMIHLEDLGFSHSARIGLFRIESDNSHRWGVNDNLYDIIKVCNNYNTLDYITQLSIAQDREMVYSFVDWQRINSELLTAIKRITKNTEDVTIKASLSEFLITIPMSKKFELVDGSAAQLCNLLKSFNFHHNKVMYPEFHYDKGVVIYLREIPKKGEGWVGDFKSVEISDELRALIERDFNIVKLYNKKGDVLIDNPYLVDKSSQLSQFITMELEPKNFKIIC